MALGSSLVADQSASIIRQNMAKIKLLTVAGPLLCNPAQEQRIVRLLENRRSWGIERPLVMLAVHQVGIRRLWQSSSWLLEPLRAP